MRNGSRNKRRSCESKWFAPSIGWANGVPEFDFMCSPLYGLIFVLFPFLFYSLSGLASYDDPGQAAYCLEKALRYLRWMTVSY